ncbi:hypothetical protein BMS3Bbin02_00753 [bacterium BMS3Bbin02]|nr:hypothetical protein BMS3Bbin02_00753 [bacterium BMS3Bbin02]
MEGIPRLVSKCSVRRVEIEIGRGQRVATVYDPVDVALNRVCLGVQSTDSVACDELDQLGLDQETSPEFRLGSPSGQRGRSSSGAEGSTRWAVNLWVSSPLRTGDTERFSVVGSAGTAAGKDDVFAGPSPPHLLFCEW